MAGGFQGVAPVLDSADIERVHHHSSIGGSGDQRGEEAEVSERKSSCFVLSLQQNNKEQDLEQRTRKGILSVSPS